MYSKAPAGNGDRRYHRTPFGRWLNGAFSSSEPVGLPWLVLWAYVRISTNLSLPKPLPVSKALDDVDTWVRQPNAEMVQPGPSHLGILGDLMRLGGVSGARTTDAILAAIAIEHGATLVSADRDFARFTPRLRWIDPLTA
ncbi:MAG: TA system VapC family ribonuclease toxin [Bryobacteraceae bacterium]|nr:TA system VapC family ribonuclease toxin [Bryobacteraceae bacterium]